MRIGRIVGLALFLLFSASISFADETQDAAQSMVTTLGLGTNLGSLGLQAAKRMTTYAIIVRQLGEAKAEALVKEELGRVQPKYQKQWNDNLALSYAEFFEPAEMQSIASERQTSQHFAKFINKQPEVGQSMQGRSKDLLIAFVVDGMKGALTKVANEAQQGASGGSQKP
ncbi:hypothetical protein ACFPN2_17370 [Steroidobacter flavus]|uniref:DUF2059 domain-containing protein n=1 Tax=Steroidobacter flavus TaxID=1842136 RepID=A0ABV8SX12_9GAMM